LPINKEYWPSGIVGALGGGYFLIYSYGGVRDDGKEKEE
jgi:hypothetical protein